MTTSPNTPVFRLTLNEGDGEGACAISFSFGLPEVLDQDRAPLEIEAHDFQADEADRAFSHFAQWSVKHAKTECTGIFDKTVDDLEDFYGRCFCTSVDLSKAVYL